MLIFVVFCIYLFLNYYFYFDALLKLEGRDLSASGRTVIWKDGIKLYMGGGFFSILFGNGFDAFSDALNISAHSFYVKHLYESGLFFIVAFLLFNAYMLVRAVRDSYSSDPILSSVAIFMLLIIVFMLVRNLGTPSFFQVRVENIIYFASMVIYMSARKRSYENVKKLIQHG